MSYSSALPATLPRFQTIATSKSSLDVATGHEYEVLSVVGLVDVATSHDTYTLIRRYTDSGAGRETYMLIRRYMDYGGGYDTYFSKLQTIATSRSSLDVATGREHATLLIKALADVATPHEVYALIRRYTDSGTGRDTYVSTRRCTDSGVGHSSVTFISSRCVITRAIYGGLRICYKKEGDLLDFETLWYILLTLRRVDEFIQDIAQID